MKNGDVKISLAKKIIPRDKYKILKKIKEKNERNSVFKIHILKALDERYSLLELKINFLKSKGFDTLFANNYVLLFGTKIAYLKHHFSEDSLIKTIVLLNKSEKEVKKIYV